MRLTALTIAMLTVLAGSAHSAPAPDSTGLSRLHAASSEWKQFRVATSHSQFLVNSLHFDPDSVVVREPQGRPALFVTADTDPGAPKRVAWSQIESIEGVRPHVRRGVVTGAIVGGLVGFAAKGTFEKSLHDASSAAIIAIPIGAAFGALIGAFVGGTTGWHRVYP